MTKPKAGLAVDWKQQLYPKGKPVAQRWPERSVEERFLAKVGEPTESGCHPWLGYIRHGYGHFTVDAQHGGLAAYRVAYELFVGPIPKGMTVDHACHSADMSCPGGPSCLHRRCVNPAHLELVTLAENKARGRSPAAINARKDRCFRGHLFNEENTHYPPSGGRSCRACNRLEKREFAAAKRAARPDRFCEAPGCSNPIPREVRPDKRTCSPACRTRLGRSARGQLCAS